MCMCVCGGDWMNTEKRERKLRVDRLYTAVYHIALNFRGSKLFLRIVSFEDFVEIILRIRCMCMPHM